MITAYPHLCAAARASWRLPGELCLAATLSGLKPLQKDGPMGKDKAALFVATSNSYKNLADAANAT
ncbi:hypothetical protein GO308_17610 [Sphingomonas sp. SFZ2018-12]|uniref:hypothetical protein n=1 Tax=Sphingomonas sp. SFZ2018-12 TaxID=2683197 RepID=UPI001F0E73D6|nr:hypothetical protein [Sphingomonas sp. SFZ2018-12]MCH4894924.1 hypothetical protein [Sphingomonas sp. SFZ2018-12]